MLVYTLKATFMVALVISRASHASADFDRQKVIGMLKEYLQNNILNSPQCSADLTDTTDGDVAVKCAFHAEGLACAECENGVGNGCTIGKDSHMRINGGECNYAQFFGVCLARMEGLETPEVINTFKPNPHTLNQCPCKEPNDHEF